MTPINMSRELFARVAPYARIPSMYVQLLMNKTATCVLATPEVPSKKSPLSSPRVVRDEYLCGYAKFISDGY